MGQVQRLQEQTRPVLLPSTPVPSSLGLDQMRTDAVREVAQQLPVDPDSMQGRHHNLAKDSQGADSSQGQQFTDLPTAASP